jgi:hypothetical protein
MNRPTIDALACGASAMKDRRASLAALGASVMAATVVIPQSCRGQEELRQESEEEMQAVGRRLLG